VVHSDPTAEKGRSKAALRGRRRKEANAESTAGNYLNVVEPVVICQGLEINAERKGEDLVSLLYMKNQIKRVEFQEEEIKKDTENLNGEALLPSSPMQSIGPSALVRLDTFVPIGFNGIQCRPRPEGALK
jgi:hypothetical protein